MPRRCSIHAKNQFITGQLGPRQYVRGRNAADSGLVEGMIWWRRSGWPVQAVDFRRSTIRASAAESRPPQIQRREAGNGLRVQHGLGAEVAVQRQSRLLVDGRDDTSAETVRIVAQLCRFCRPEPLCQPDQCLVGHCEDRGHEPVGDEKADRLPNPLVVVVRAFQLLDDPQVTVVFDGARALAGVGDDPHVASLVEGGRSGPTVTRE